MLCGTGPNQIMFHVEHYLVDTAGRPRACPSPNGEGNVRTTPRSFDFPSHALGVAQDDGCGLALRSFLACPEQASASEGVERARKTPSLCSRVRLVVDLEHVLHGKLGAGPAQPRTGNAAPTKRKPRESTRGY